MDLKDYMDWLEVDWLLQQSLNPSAAGKSLLS